jgi:hypothetical protein
MTSSKTAVALPYGHALPSTPKLNAYGFALGDLPVRIAKTGGAIQFPVTKP